MRRDTAALVGLLSGLLSLALLISGLVVATPTGPASAVTPSRVVASPAPTYRVGPPELGPARVDGHRRTASARGGASAAAANPGHITGTVTAEGDGPLDDLEVVAFRWDSDDEYWDYFRYTYTGPSGSYDLGNLTAGTYRIGFDPDQYLADYQSEYWDDATTLSDATSISIVAGQTVAGTDAELSAQGRITGTVTGPGATPLEGIHVTAYRQEFDDEEDYFYEFDDTWTDSDGTYDLGSLPDGTYRVGFFDHYTGYLAEYWHDTTEWVDATNIEVVAGEVLSGTDAQLTVGAKVSGVITDADGDPVEGIEVQAYLWDEDTESWEFAYYTESVETGLYDLSGIRSGTYRIGFLTESDYYLSEYWDDARTLEDATSVTAVAGGAPVDWVDAQLSKGGSITGVVTGVDGEPRWDAQVLAYRWSDDDEDWEPYYDAWTDWDGSYELGGLEPGTYRLSFTGDPGDQIEFWDDAATLASATDIDVSVDQTVSGVDAELADESTPRIANGSLPTISGVAQVGSTLTATAGTWSPASGLAYSYRWIVDGATVDGATAPTYVPDVVDIGKTVQVRLRVSRSGYAAATALSAATTAVIAAPEPTISNLSPPYLSSVPQVGSTVNATSGTWTVPASVDYQWLVAGSPVTGATTSSYHPTAADVGKPLQVRVTANAPGRTAATATSAVATVGKGTLKATKKPKVTGKAKKNATLTVSPGTWKPKVAVRYQWFAGAKAIPKATATKLKLAGKTLKAVARKAISVVVTVTAPGYSTVTTKLKVSGTVKLG
jgi:hypothetical protein